MIGGGENDEWILIKIEFIGKEKNKNKNKNKKGTWRYRVKESAWVWVRREIKCGGWV